MVQAATTGASDAGADMRSAELGTHLKKLRTPERRPALLCERPSTIQADPLTWIDVLGSEGRYQGRSVTATSDC